jgi:hypothetical protein
MDILELQEEIFAVFVRLHHIHIFEIEGATIFIGTAIFLFYFILFFNSIILFSTFLTKH